MKFCLFISVITIALVNTACNQGNKINGLFLYTESTEKEESLIGLGAKIGREMVCESVGMIEFKNGKCYYEVSMLGTETSMRLDYTIEDDIIYFEDGNIGQMKMIDQSTIMFQGCTFKLVDPTKVKEMKTASAVNMRTGPGTQYRKIEKLKKGKTVYILDSISNEGWYQIRYNWTEGYVSSKFLIP